MLSKERHKEVIRGMMEDLEERNRLAEARKRKEAFSIFFDSDLYLLAILAVMLCLFMSNGCSDLKVKDHEQRSKYEKHDR